MPHYDYKCSECEYEFEAFHKMSEIINCPKCGGKVNKILSCGAAVIIKGTTTPCRGGRKINLPGVKKIEKQR